MVSLTLRYFYFIMLLSNLKEDLMSQKLEDFLKKHRLLLEFTETVTVINTFSGRKKIRREEARWMCHLPSIFMGQTVSIEHRRGAVNLYFASGKTRKEVREQLVNFVRGKTLVYGYNRKYKFKVPENIR